MVKVKRDAWRQSSPVGATTPRQHFEPWGGAEQGRPSLKQMKSNESHGMLATGGRYIYSKGPHLVLSSRQQQQQRLTEPVEQVDSHGKSNAGDDEALLLPVGGSSALAHRPQRPRRGAILRVRGEGGGGEASVPDEQDHHGERAVPGADHRGEQRRHAGDQGGEHGAVQRHPPLARPQAAAERVGGRAGVRDAVPHPAREQLHVPVHRRGAGGDAVVARAQLMAPRHRPRRAHHPPQARDAIPVPQARAGVPRPPGGVVEEGPHLRDQAVHDHRRAAQHLRHHPHQRTARRFPPLLQPRDERHPGGRGRDVPAADHQRGNELRALRLPRRPQDDRGRRRRSVHQAFRDQRRARRPRPDHGRPRHRQRRPGPLLPRRPRLRLRAGRPFRQHHRHRHLPVQERARLRRNRRSGKRRAGPSPVLGPSGPRGAGADAPVPADEQRHEHGDRVLEQHPEPGAGEGARTGDAGGVHHHRVRPLQLPAGPVLPGPQQHPVRREHEQRLLPAPQHRLAAAGALPPHPRRLHRGLPGVPAGDIRLHLAERPARALAAREGHQAVPRQVRRRGADRVPGHGHLRRRGAPHAHPRLPLLRPRHGLRQLQPEAGRGQVQHGRPAQPEHHRRASRRVGRRALRGGQPGSVARALPHRRASHRRARHGAGSGGRQDQARVHGAAAAGPTHLRPVEDPGDFCTIVHGRERESVCVVSVVMLPVCDSNLVL